MAVEKAKVAFAVRGHDRDHRHLLLDWPLPKQASVVLPHVIGHTRRSNGRFAFPIRMIWHFKILSYDTQHQMLVMICTISSA